MTPTIQKSLAKALEHHKAGQLPQAEALYIEILKVAPNQPDALHYLGMLAHQMGHNDAAVGLIAKALSVNPDYFQAHNNLGNVYQSARQLEDAIACFHKATTIKPDYAEAFFNLGNALQQLGQLDDAVTNYETALSLRPDYLDAQNNLGSLYQKQGRSKDAAHMFKKIIAQKPDYAMAYTNLGLALAEMERYDDAIANHQRALSLDPNLGQAGYNLSLAQLVLGDFENGWKNYAYRWQTDDFPPRNYNAPKWDGQNLQGKTILVNTEQGHGDIVQFARFLPALQNLGARVVLEVPRSLAQLIKDSTIADVLITPEDFPPPFDYHISQLDLPRVMQTTLGTIPGDMPYITVSPNQTDKWMDIIGPKSTFRVGLVWAGNADHKYDSKRSINASLFLPLLERDNVDFYSLQLGRDGEAVLTFGDKVTDLAPQLTNYSDTAAAISQLDLIISVDTSVAHVAGATGAKIWTLLSCAPDWRWLLKRDDSPWYPQMRLFRQDTPGNWTEVIQHVCTALGAIL